MAPSPAAYPYTLPATAPSVVYPHTTSPEVPVLRRRLAAAGWPDVLTPETDDATLADDEFVTTVAAFQLAHGLVSDGVAGPRTRARLPPPEGSWSERATAEGSVTVRANACAAAQRYVGVVEEPKGTNRGPHLDPLVVPYLRAMGLLRADGTGGTAWCAVAVCAWVAEGWGEPAPKTPFGRYIGAVRDPRYPNLAWWADRHGLLRPSVLDDDLIGAFFIMGRAGSDSDTAAEAAVTRAGHTGLITGIDWPKGRFQTVEGNVRDGVRVCTRKPSDLLALVPWWQV